MEQPHGFRKGEAVCLLRKALYGLKQAPREWYATLREFFETIGFVRVKKDHSVFVHKNGSVISLYINDLLILTPTVALMEQLKE